MQASVLILHHQARSKLLQQQDQKRLKEETWGLWQPFGGWYGKSATKGSLKTMIARQCQLLLQLRIWFRLPPFPFQTLTPKLGFCFVCSVQALTFSLLLIFTAFQVSSCSCLALLAAACLRPVCHCVDSRVLLLSDFGQVAQSSFFLFWAAASALLPGGCSRLGHIILVCFLLP